MYFLEHSIQRSCIPNATEIKIQTFRKGPPRANWERLTLILEVLIIFLTWI